MISNRSLRCRLTPQMVLCIFMALKILWITVSKSMKLKEAVLLWTLTTCFCLCFSCVRGTVNTAYTDHFPGEPGETSISLSCLLLPAPWCPAVSQRAHGGVCGDLSAHGVPNCILCHFGYRNVRGRALCYSYYPFVSFSITVTESPSSYCMHQFFEFLPFPKIYISPRHGFTNFLPSAFDERLFAGFLPSCWGWHSSWFNYI